MTDGVKTFVFGFDRFKRCVDTHPLLGSFPFSREAMKGNMKVKSNEEGKGSTEKA